MPPLQPASTADAPTLLPVLQSYEQEECLNDLNDDADSGAQSCKQLQNSAATTMAQTLI
jgi:hypothetical protein